MFVLTSRLTRNDYSKRFPASNRSLLEVMGCSSTSMPSIQRRDGQQTRRGKISHRLKSHTADEYRLQAKYMNKHSRLRNPIEILLNYYDIFHKCLQILLWNISRLSSPSQPFQYFMNYGRFRAPPIGWLHYDVKSFMKQFVELSRRFGLLTALAREQSLVRQNIWEDDEAIVAAVAVCKFICWFARLKALPKVLAACFTLIVVLKLSRDRDDGFVMRK